MEIDGTALELAVVLQGDAVEPEPAAVVLQPAARLLQASVLLPPLDLRGGSEQEEHVISPSRMKQ